MSININYKNVLLKTKIMTNFLDFYYGFLLKSYLKDTPKIQNSEILKVK